MTALDRDAAGPHAATGGHDRLGDWLTEHGAGLIALRRNIHAHPELSGDEHGTTELVYERLALAGLEPRGLDSGTGVLCDLRPDGPHRQGTFALRADLDALAMADQKDVPYRSQHPGVSHACGHDVHTTVVLGATLFFAQHPEELPGPVRAIFQPAEERVPGGALDVIAGGGLDDVDSIIGVHCEPKLDVGTIGVKAGPISSAADMAVITVTGPGGHTARPELTVDIVDLVGTIVKELPQRVTERVGSADDVKIVFGAVHAGDAANVVPTTGSIKASIRTPSIAVWDSLPGIVADEVAAIVAAAGADHELDYTHGVPPVVNHAGVTDTVRRAATAAFGDDAVVDVEQSWGGDDFAWFTRQVPGSYVRLGVRTPGGPTLDLHHGHFDVDEHAIELGVRLLVNAVREHYRD
jgi:amidohydrolase